MEEIHIHTNTKTDIQYYTMFMYNTYTLLSKVLSLKIYSLVIFYGSVSSDETENEFKK